MTAWILSMVDETELSFKSIVNYLWGMRTWQSLQGKSDPAMGVRSWRELMRSVAVLTAVPSEPRAQVPLDVLRDILERLRSSDAFEDVQLHLVLLVLLFTFSRTECPCPKAWTGPNVFDPEQHWEAGDFRLLPGAQGKGYVLWVRFKRIKQDPRVERASMVHADPFVPDELCGDGGFGRDWVPVGDVPDDPLFSVALAYQRFVRAVGRPRAATESMFMDRACSRPYTYSCLLTDFKRLCEAVGCDLPLGPHGLRVLGYNLSKAGNGVELTVAHGGWVSEAHSRYSRFSQQQVLGVPAGMLGVQSQFVGERPVSRVRARRGAGHPLEEPGLSDMAGLALSASDDDDEPVADAARGARELPPGYERVDLTYPSGRSSFVVNAPDGSRCRSIAEAWRHYGVAALDGTPATPTQSEHASPPSVVRHPSPVSRARPRASSARRTRSSVTSRGAAAALVVPVAQQGVEDLSDAIVYADRPSARHAPRERG